MFGPIIWTAYHSIGPVTEFFQGKGLMEIYRAHAWSFFIWVCGLFFLIQNMSLWFFGLNFIFMMILILMIWNFEDDGNVPRAQLLYRGLQIHGFVCVSALFLS
jgi:hypothetical protein